MSEITIDPYGATKPIARNRDIGILFRTILVPLLLITSIFILWIVSLPQIDPSKMNDLGLVSVLPITYFAALVFLAVSYMINVHQRDAHEIILLLHILLLIFIIHGTPQIVYGTLRYSWAWKHVGIIDYIQRNGSVDPTITNLNAYHNWPGFFALAALFNSVAGLPSSLSYAGWSPVFFNLIDLGALLVLLKTLTDDKRLVWLSVWIFYLFSWIGQDYFSPQAFAYFLFLVAIIIVLKWFRRLPVLTQSKVKPGSRSQKLYKLYVSIVNHPSEDQPVVITSTRQRLFFMAVLIMIFVVIASSHQLTPLMLTSALALLVIFQVTNQRFIPILMGTIAVIWIIFMAVGFLNGNLYWIIKSIGSLLENVNGNFINLAVASSDQQFVAKIDRLMSAAVWVLGFAGLYRRYRSGKWDLPAILLAIAPIPMIALNSYGGEMIFRVYMFSLPFVAYLAGSLFYPSLTAGISLKAPLISTLLSFILIPSFIISYYGKERMNYFSPNEVIAAEFIFNNAPKGSLIMDGVFDWPRQYTHYEDYNYLSLSLLPPDQIRKVLQNPALNLSYYMDVAAPGAVFVNPTTGKYGDIEPNLPGVQGKADYPAAYFVITRAQLAETEMTGSLPQNWYSIITSSLTHSANFKLVYSNPDAVIYQYIDLGER